MSKPDPKPRARVRDKALLAEFAKKPCQATGLSGGAFEGLPMFQVETHHLVKQPRHDERGNLFRLLHSLHIDYESSPRRMAVATLIRAYMTYDQYEYVKKEKGLAWLDATYPLSSFPSGLGE